MIHPCLESLSIFVREIVAGTLGFQEPMKHPIYTNKGVNVKCAYSN